MNFKVYLKHGIFATEIVHYQYFKEDKFFTGNWKDFLKGIMIYLSSLIIELSNHI